MAISNKLARVIHCYKVLSLIAFNTFLFFLLLNVVTWAFLNSRKAIRVVSSSIESVHSLQEVYPGYTREDIALLTKESWNDPFQYEPWVGFKERPRSGRFVNVDKEGFRISHRKDLRLDDDGIAVYVFGGSTTFGYRLADDSTIPAHLERRLSVLYPENKINVFNFGRAYYYSTQELAFLLQLLRNGHTPDVAIFIDGLNETLRPPHYTKELSYMFDAYNYDGTKFYRLVAEQVPLFRYFMSKLQQEAKAKTGYNSEPVEILNQYLRNRDTISLLSKQYGFSAYFFIHPIPGYLNVYANHKYWTRPVSEEFANLDRKMELLDNTTDDRNSFNMTHLLADYPLQPFVDEVHFTSHVCDRIAEFIIQRIKLPIGPRLDM